MPDQSWWHYLPQQWVGMLALFMFMLHIGLQLAEKYPTLAKVLPLGRWWHDRRNRDRRIGDEAVEALQRRVESISRTAAKQSEDIKQLQDTVAAFTAWSVYDARWHHRVSVINAEHDACRLPKHYDFFEFERIWRKDPTAAAQLAFQ